MASRSRRFYQSIALFVVVAEMLLVRDNLVNPAVRMLVVGAGMLALIYTTSGYLRAIHAVISPLDFGWLPFVLLTGLTVLLSVSPRGSLDVWLLLVALQLPVAYGLLLVFRRWTGRLFYRLMLIVGGYFYMQALAALANYLSESVTVRAAGLTSPVLRLFGIVDYPNIFAMIIAMTIPCIAAYALVKLNRFERLAAGAWLIGAAIALYGTGSRGGLTAALSGGALAVALAVIAHPGQLPARFRAWARAHRLRALVFSTVSAVLVLAAVGAAFYLQFGRPRQDSGAGRLGFYSSAWQMFVSHPLTGEGPGSFAWDEIRTHSIPSYRPLPHAHDLVLGMAAESGLLGLIGLFALVAAAIWTCVAAWRSRPERRSLIAGPIGGLVAFCLTGILDSPTGDFWPFAVATALLAYIAAGLPAPMPGAIRFRWLRASLIRVSLWGVALLFALVLIPHSVLNAVPVAEQSGANVGDLTASAQQLDALSTVDPGDGLVVLQSAYNWAQVAAANADPHNPALTNAIERFERGIPYDPDLGLHYLNLSVLYAKAGRPVDAVDAAQQAAKRAYDDPAAWLNLGLAQERAGSADKARDAYIKTLQVEPRWAAAGFWQATSVRADALARYLAAPDEARRYYDLLAQADSERDAGLTDEALADYHEVLAHTPGLARQAYVRGLIALTKGDQEQSRLEMTQATFAEMDDWGPAPDAWLYLGDMAGDQGDKDTMLRNYAAAYRFFTSRGLLGFGASGTADYTILTFKRIALVSDYLPDVVMLDITPPRAARFKVLAQSMIMQGKSGEAARIYREILQANPGDVRARADMTSTKAGAIRP